MERDLTRYQPVGVKLWRAVYSLPISYLRRRLFVWLKIRSGKGLAVSELAPEKAAQEALARKAVNHEVRIPGEE